MSRTPLPEEHYAAMSHHWDALNYANRVRKHQTLKKRSRLEKRFAGVPRCPECHLPLPLCKCQ